MHTARQLSAGLFEITRNGRPADRADLFPGWGALDRLGVVMTEPFGAVGASFVIQLAITAFYDAVGSRREGSLQNNDPRAIYPEIYLFHVGGRFGDHSAYDFWPARKEIFVPGEARAVLDAVNDRAITRLLVPDGPLRPVEHEWKEPAAAHDRVRTVLVYGSSGRVSDPDWRITGLTPATESNVRRTLDPDRRFSAGPNEPDLPSDPVLRSRQWRVRAEQRHREGEAGLGRARARRQELRDGRGRAVEEYRNASVEQALAMLV